MEFNSSKEQKSFVPQKTTQMEFSSTEEGQEPHMPQRYIIIGGMPILLSNAKRVIDESTTVFYKKEDRENLDVHKLNDLFIKAVTTSQKKYDFINIKLDDPDILEETYNLGMAITTTKVNHSQFDMHNVFAIVDPNNGFATTDLYKNHALLTQEEVAINNEFYQTMTEDPNNKWSQ